MKRKTRLYHVIVQKQIIIKAVSKEEAIKKVKAGLNDDHITINTKEYN